MTEADTTIIDNKFVINRVDYFLIDNEIYLPSDVHSDIAKFVRLNLMDLPKKYANYRAEFYKRTGELNLTEIKMTPEELKWKLFQYAKPFDEYKYFNGEKY